MQVFLKTNLITKTTCQFPVAGLPPRVGVRVGILNLPNYGLHCRATKDDPNCCCLPISQTWHMKCAEALAYLNANGLNSQTNPTCSGGVGNRCVMGFC